MNTFFTSDTHFGHRNIIKYTGRPFASVEEMDRVLVERWNEVVEPNDTVWHLGDFTLGDRKMAEHYFSQLNGLIKVVGNHWHHDHRWVPLMPGETKMRSASGHNVYIAQPIVVLGKYGAGSQHLVLSHYPQYRWDQSHRGAYHLYGHTHKDLIVPWTPHFDDDFKKQSPDLYYGPPRCLDVGVDTHNFYPITFEQAVAFIEARNAREYAVPNFNTPVVSKIAEQEIHDAMSEYDKLK